MAFAAYNFSLDEEALRAGNPAQGRTDELMNRLSRGLPISVAVLGASVALNGGCLTQPGKRCMENNGNQPTRLTHGAPRLRPFKGFIVRWFEWLNDTWPHSGHQLINNARDANSLSPIVPCLFSHLPNRVDLVIVEAGSIVPGNTPTVAELLARQLLGMRGSPAILFATVRAWCKFGSGAASYYRPSYGISSLREQKLVYPWGRYGELANATRYVKNTTSLVHKAILHVKSLHNPSDVLDDSITSICRHYDIGCVSQRDALLPSFLLGRTGFGVTDIAGDCLHPFHGRRGTEYLSDLLVYWTMLSARNWQMRQSASGGPAMLHDQPKDPSTISTLARQYVMPPPLFATNWAAYSNKHAACFQLATEVGSSSATKTSVLSWQSAHCNEHVNLQRLSKLFKVGSHALKENGVASVSAHHAQHCNRMNTPVACPTFYPSMKTSRLPDVWVHCAQSTMPGQRKESPGTAAFLPGATLYVELPTNWLPAADTAASGPVPFNVSINFLTSWHHMGVVQIACSDACVCDEHLLSAHETSDVRNSTIYKEHRFVVIFASTAESVLSDTSTASKLQGNACGLMMRVDSSTSSDGHHFKIRDIVLFTASSPCSDARLHKFLFARSGLKCSS